MDIKLDMVLPPETNTMDALVKNFTYWDKALSIQEVTASFNNVSPTTSDVYSFTNPMKYEILSGTIHLGLGTWILKMFLNHILLV